MKCLWCGMEFEVGDHGDDQCLECLNVVTRIGAAIRRGLIRVADSVAKHLIVRGGLVEGDECFEVDLRESEEEILRAVFAREGVFAGVQRNLADFTKGYPHAVSGTVARVGSEGDGGEPGLPEQAAEEVPGG